VSADTSGLRPHFPSPFLDRPPRPILSTSILFVLIPLALRGPSPIHRPLRYCSPRQAVLVPRAAIPWTMYDDFFQLGGGEGDNLDFSFAGCNVTLPLWISETMSSSPAHPLQVPWSECILERRYIYYHFYLPKERPLPRSAYKLFIASCDTYSAQFFLSL